MRPDYQTIKRLVAKRVLFGIGENDSPRPKAERGKAWVIHCPFYTAWHRMMSDCYGRHSARVVCQEWNVFSRFKAWMQTQDYADKLLYTPLTTIYEPEFSVFIPINVAEFIGAFRRPPKYPPELLFRSNRISFMQRGSEPVRFRTRDEAMAHWRRWKTEQGKQLASEQTDERIALVIHDYLLNLHLDLC